MFFSVKFGEGKTEFFNADCMVWQVVESIFNKCNCYQTGTCTFALADAQCHKIINLSKLSESRGSGTEIFKEREAYILLSVTTDKKSNEDSYTVLLEEEFLDPAFRFKLESRNTRRERSSSTISTTSTRRKRMKKTLTVQQF